MGPSFSKMTPDNQQKVIIMTAGGIMLLATAAVVLTLSLRRRATKHKLEETPRTSKRRRSNVDLNDRALFPAGPLPIYFGSQTGTAEGFAKILQKEGRNHGFAARVHDLEDFDPDQLQSQRVALFLMATYGEGDPTDNAMNFAKWCKNEDESTQSDFLDGLSYGVFGLGNTQYEKYNSMGKETDAGLEKFGAIRVLELGLGDDNGTLEEDFDKWKEAMWPVLLTKFHPQGAKAASMVADEDQAAEQEEPPFKLEFVGPPSSSRNRAFSESEVSHSSKFYFNSVDAKVTCNRELRSPKDGGSTRHIELDIQAAKLQYQTADNLAVLAHNSTEVVEKLAASQQYDLDAYFVLTGEKPRFPTPCSIREALTQFIDLTSLPKRSFVGQLAKFAKDPADASRLRFLASKDGLSDYKQYVESAGRTLVDLVTESFPSVYLPLSHLINLAPHLQPRYYTISSSSSVHPSSIHITVAVVKDQLSEGRVHKGVCSSYLAETNTQSVKVFVRPSTFRLPPDPSMPIIMIGPGTGIAPMRALLQERQYQRKVLKNAVGETILFFGCKRRDQDYIYEDELSSFSKDGTLTSLHLAFSREQQNKVYVQHLMAKPEISQHLWALLDTKCAFVYVCGATRMGMDVHKALVDIIKTGAGMKDEEALGYVKNLQNNGRYVQELWSGA